VRGENLQNLKQDPTHDATWQQLKCQGITCCNHGREGGRTFSFLHCIIVVLVIKNHIASSQPVEHEISNINLVTSNNVLEKQKVNRSIKYNDTR